MDNFVIAKKIIGNTVTLDINNQLYVAIFRSENQAKQTYLDFNNPNRNSGKILSNLRKDNTVEIDKLQRSDDTFPRMPWEEETMRIEKKVKEVNLIEITEDVKIGGFILEKGDKVRVILKEKKKWNSGFSGYVITDIAAGNVKRLEAVLLDNDIAWDALMDMGWTQFITDVQDKDQWKDLADEIYRRTGLSVYDSSKNQ